MLTFHTETFTKDGPVPTSAEISVYAQGGVSLAQIYEADGDMPKANPFTITDGMIAFTAARGIYRIHIDDGTSPYDLDHISIG